MNDKIRKVDIASWNRKDIFNFYGDFDEPRFTIVSKIDVTNLYNTKSLNRISFYFSLIYLSIKAMESIEEFHYRIKNNEVFYYQSIYPSFTILKDGERNFKIVTTSIKDDESIIDFSKRCRILNFNAKEFFNNDIEFDEEQLVYITCIPWINVISLVEERKFDKNDSIPHIAWGKYEIINGRYYLNYELQVNHRLIDGLQVGEYFLKLQELIDNLKN